tara:strand:+ start:24198 stop:25016 length:819 start_codon:yes stop_codon:yes gene_type:complete
MNERKRQAYLEAMDIQVYFPRQQLPGAKPSPVYDFPAVSSVLSELDELAESNQTQTAISAKSESKANGLAAIEELRSRPPAARKATVTPIRQATELPKSEIETDADLGQENSLSFTLRYYRINERLAVLDEVPLQGSRQLSEASLSLMQAILKALGQQGLESPPKAEEFSWPLQSGYSMKNSPKIEAAKAISGFLQMRKETDGFTNLLVFAGQVEDVFLQFDVNKSARDFESSKDYFITVTHSLASMLAVSTLKRDVWQHLQALRKRIDSSS